MPSDPAVAVRALRACRAAMISVCGQVKPMGAAYHGANMVVAAIDGFAAFLTGQRHYFQDIGSTMSEGRRELLEDQKARENGEKPWDL
ncbi:MAG: hypothetical protein ABSA13_12925 [Beijerinckiaceae bacterium]|jgi:hypothetical protein